MAVRSLKPDKSDRLVTRGEVVKAIRYLVREDVVVRAEVAAIAASVRPLPWWRRVVAFFRVGK